MSGLKIDRKAWVLVGDGEKALIFRNTGTRAHPELEVITLLDQDNPKTSHQGTDAPGRKSDGPGNQVSAMEETDWHQLEKHRFAVEMAEHLYKAAHKNNFSQLIVVAPPTILGNLRKEFHPEVADRVVAEVDKTLTNHPLDKIVYILTEKTAA
ncbi:protein required for attachment to host cells [Roseibium hamelinense]|uniref:Protein required for attachment to host cells n=1 Tax=Roseibium hamelinense TaxID=150831 RepID=A0A562SKZ3_9HYPH|nr:host attachment family protein [Roseibium hamelinense]MTI43415.1 host attachment protein [Roseibium hamelinense]TWI81872.1 protein required for attachment to host cells [Roseibium hamelinense]